MLSTAILLLYGLLTQWHFTQNIHSSQNVFGLYGLTLMFLFLWGSNFDGYEHEALDLNSEEWKDHSSFLKEAQTHVVEFPRILSDKLEENKLTREVIIKKFTQNPKLFATVYEKTARLVKTQQELDKSRLSLNDKEIKTIEKEINNLADQVCFDFNNSVEKNSLNKNPYLDNILAKNALEPTDIIESNQSDSEKFVNYPKAP